MAPIGVRARHTDEPLSGVLKPEFVGAGGKFLIK